MSIHGEIGTAQAGIAKGIDFAGHPGPPFARVMQHHIGPFGISQRRNSARLTCGRDIERPADPVQRVDDSRRAIGPADTLGGEPVEF